MEKLPYNLDAEKSIIYSILVENDKVNEVFVELSESDFHAMENRTLIKVIKELHEQGKTLEPVTINDYLDSHPDLRKSVPESYTMDILDMIASPSNIHSYIEIVSQKSKLKKLIITMKSMMEEAHGIPEDADLFMDRVQQSIFDLSMKRSRNEIVEIKDALKDFYEKLKMMQGQTSTLTGVTTGFKHLDDVTGGLQPSDLIILAARPAMGKTSLALNILANAAKAGHKVAIFSLEMPVIQLVNRIIAAEASLDSSKLRKGKLNADDWNKLNVAMAKLIKDKMYFDDTGSITVGELASKARMLKMKEGLDLIVIDYIQLMKGTGESSRELEISTISRSLKTLAKELNVPMLVLSQLNRKVDSRPNKRPMISDLRESGAIEQDADQILFIYRGEVYNDPEMEEGVAEVIIAKNRHGSIGEFLLVFQSQFTKFENRMEDHYEDMDDEL